MIVYALVTPNRRTPRTCSCAVKTPMQRSLALRDEPGWHDLLSVVPIELDERDLSPN